VSPVGMRVAVSALGMCVDLCVLHIARVCGLLTSSQLLAAQICTREAAFLRAKGVSERVVASVWDVVSFMAEGAQ
jgi:hypothetical protein